MKNYDLITPEGTKDLLFNECVFRRNAEDMIFKIFKKRGYSEIITPGLEFFDVFNLNSRHFPQEDLYKLTDRKGRLLVLRPDSTMPIARVVATRLKDAMLPLRLCYNQCAYKISPLMTGRSDQIVQAGIELIGSESITADLEVIEAAIEVLSSCNPNDFSLEIGDMGYFKELVNRLEINDSQKENIRFLIESKNYPALNDLLDSIGDNEITAALKHLPRLFGGDEVFEKAEKLFSDKKISNILENLRFIYGEISKLGYDGKIKVDLGMVNRTDYYTGVTIKGYLAGCGEEVLSGGRYDKLIAEFGYDVPATGFAVSVDAAAKVMAELVSVKSKPSDIIVYAEKGYEMNGILVARDLRSRGFVVENALADNLEAAKHYAQQMRIAKVVVVNGESEEV